MSETQETSQAQDPERLERQLRNVRLKLVSARRELQTLTRQSSLRHAEKQMRKQIDMAERRVLELEQSESELVKRIGPSEESTEEVAGSTATTEGTASASPAESGLAPKEISA